MPRTLDFTALPNESFFEGRPMLATLPAALEARLVPLPQTLERVQATLMFAHLAAQQSEPRRAAAFLRAALAEYCSIEEMQRTDKPAATHLQLTNLKDPLLHLLELMRHLNIHVKTMQAAPYSVLASFEDQAFHLNVAVISNLDAADLARLKNGKHYALSDLQQAVAWFQKSQLHWGAGYVIRLGTESFANALCTHYGL